MSKTEVNDIQLKRSYIDKLEHIQDLLLDLYKYREVNSIRAIYDPYHFTEQLDIFLEYLEDEIEHQTDKLNNLEVTIYNMSGSSQD